MSSLPGLPSVTCETSSSALSPKKTPVITRRPPTNWTVSIRKNFPVTAPSMFR